MKAVSSEVAPREHQEMAWLFAVLCLNMIGMLAVVRACGPECLCMQGFRVEFSRWVFAEAARYL